MGDQAHRFSQPPSKVLHIRNLPYETTHEELIELATPFGKLVQSKLNVGPNRNQAFIEFPDQACAVAMCNYFNGSSEPAKVRGKTVYLQYSNRQEIINARNMVDMPSNVLLVSLENLLPDVPITLEVLHLVFSAFGFVHKIATFEKQAGLQALVQFDDVATAEAVRGSLDGRHIPKHLLGDTPYPPLLKITFSQHTDLNVRVQSHRSRDYTMNGQYLPTTSNPNDPILSLQAPINIGDPTESNILLVQIDNMAYPVTVEALHTVFSPYGFVKKIAVFEKGGQHQALVQYPDGMSATNAMNALEGHAIYDGGYNKLKLAYSRHSDLNVRGNNERSWDYTVGQAGSGRGGYGGGGGGYSGASRSAGPPPGAGVPGPADPLAGGGGAPLGQFDLPPSGTDYETAHNSVASAAEAALRNPQGGAAPYAGPTGTPPATYGAQPSPAVYQAGPTPSHQYSAPPQGPAGGYGGGTPRGPGGPPHHYGAPQRPPAYGAPQPYAGGPPPGHYGQPPAHYQGQPQQPPHGYQAGPGYPPSNGAQVPAQHRMPQHYGAPARY